MFEKIFYLAKISIMRNFKKLKAFELADNLALSIYTATKSFPKEEMFGLTSQLRRAAVSIVSNIVEGCARNSEADFLHFLDISYGSACEVEYQISLAYRLEYLDNSTYQDLQQKATETAKIINGLICSIRKS